ncbi:MAG: phage adsorption protein NrfB [Clostridiales bacterium]|jgi:adsorption protein B|nr:phage adsorption protein NrfB [Clostridiales bacterium]
MLFDMDIFSIIGFLTALLYFLLGVDDFIWDAAAAFRRLKYNRQRLDLRKLDAAACKPLAVAIAAWREDTVLSGVVDNIIASTVYPRSMYHIFLGVYPNDIPTCKAARALMRKYPNVHMVKNRKPGPTSKAQNINYIIGRIKAFEKDMGWRFASLTIHDSEDVVHPYELKATNYLLERYEAMQFPVFPLIRKPSIRNFFKNLTAGTYADEFAENHYSCMVGRYSGGAFVPSAGTGFALSRKTLDLFGDGGVLPDGCLTEDYRLSLTLFEKGVRLYYVLEKLPKVSDGGKLSWEYIATRSMFPNTFKTAVKQKTRWILGITMQSFKFKDIFKTKGLNLAARYSLYKDMKAKVGNMLAFIGYPVFIYFIISLFTPLPHIYPLYSASWYLCAAVTVMALERLTIRGLSLCHVYGIRSMSFSCLFPPLMPIRFVWGNIINFSATLMAYKQNVFGNQKKAGNHKADIKSKVNLKGQKTLVWAKTDHTFLEKPVLARYRRRLGEVLLEKGRITLDQLNEAMRGADGAETKLGRWLLGNGMITENELLTAMSAVSGIPCLDCMPPESPVLLAFADSFEKDFLKELLAAPLMRTPEGYVIAFCDESPADAKSTLSERYGIAINEVLASKEIVERVIDKIYSPDVSGPRESLIAELCGKGRIDYEQALIAYRFMSMATTSEQAALEAMSLLPASQ